MGEFEGTPRIYRERPPVVNENKEGSSRRRGQEFARVATEGFYAFFSAVAYLAQVYIETKQTLPPKERPAVAGSSVAGADTTPEATKVIPEKAPEAPVIIVAEKNVSPELVAESLKVLSALKSVGGTLRNQSPAFQKGPSADTLCTFVDTWYEKQKPNLNILWAYLDDSKSLWGQDMHSAMKTGFEIAQKASKKDKAPKTPADFEGKLKHMLEEPAKTETSCGTLFSASILGLKAFAHVPFAGRDYIGEGQKMAEQMLVGAVEVIRKDVAEAIQEKDSDRLTKAIAMAGLLGTVVDAAKAR